MKILILASPRTGSSKLQEAIAEAHQMEWFSEPFNDELNRFWDGNASRLDQYNPKRTPFIVPDNFVIKCLPFFNHWLHEENLWWGDGGIEDYMKSYFTQDYHNRKKMFFIRYMKSFDRVILLLRRNVGDQLRSMLIGEELREEAGDKINVGHWDSPYDDFDPMFTPNASLVTTFLFDCINIIETIGRIKDIPILYYEDLFIPIEETFNIKNHNFDLGLEGMWSKYFNPENRYRKE